MAAGLLYFTPSLWLMCISLCVLILVACTVGDFLSNFTWVNVHFFPLPLWVKNFHFNFFFDLIQSDGGKDWPNWCCVCKYFFLFFVCLMVLVVVEGGEYWRTIHKKICKPSSASCNILTWLTAVIASTGRSLKHILKCWGTKRNSDLCGSGP